MNPFTSLVAVVLLFVLSGPTMSTGQVPGDEIARQQAILRDPGSTEHQKQMAVLEIRYLTEIKLLKEKVAALESQNLHPNLKDQFRQMCSLREQYSKLLAERQPLHQLLTAHRDNHLGDKRIFEVYSALSEDSKVDGHNRGFMKNMSQCVFPFLQPGADRVAAAQLALDRHDLKQAQVLEQIIHLEATLKKVLEKSE